MKSCAGCAVSRPLPARPSSPMADGIRRLAPPDRRATRLAMPGARSWPKGCSGMNGPHPTYVDGSPAANSIRARRLGIDTRYEAVVFMHKECQICRSEGFTAHARVLLRSKTQQVIATLYQVTGDLIGHDEAILSEPAWQRLELTEGESIDVSHPSPLDSLSHVRSLIYGNQLGESAFHAIIGDIVDGQYSDIHLSSFLTACAARPLDQT